MTDNYVCEPCNYCTNNRKNWYSHKRTKKHKRLTDEVTEKNKEPYFCELCNYSTMTKQSFYNHRKTDMHYENELKRVAEESISVDGNYICNGCKYSTSNVNSWVKHINTKKHIMLENIGDVNFHEDLFICEACDFKTAHKSSYKRHIKTKGHDLNLAIKNLLMTNDKTDINTDTVSNNTVTNNSMENNNMKMETNNDIEINGDNNNVNSIINSNNDNRQISINFYGYEKMNVIDRETYKKISSENEPMKILEILLDKLYIKTPENRNVFYSSLSSKVCKVVTDEGLKIKLTDDVFEDRTKNVSSVKLENDEDLNLRSRVKIAEMGYEVKQSKNKVQKPSKKLSKVDKERYDDLLLQYYKNQDKYRQLQKIKDRHLVDVINNKPILELENEKEKILQELEKIENK